jgi:hypothetical protein
MKCEVLNLSYEYTDYISGHSVSKALLSFFPVSSNKQDEWKPVITLIYETEKSLRAMMDQLNGYIRDYQDDYSW